MPGPVVLTAQQARRVAVRAQLLSGPRPDDVLGVVRRLTVLQLDPTAHVAPSADLVLWSRIGSAYDPAELRQEIGVIFQDFVRFQLPAGQNLAVGRISERQNQPRIEQAAHQSLADTVIASCPRATTR